MDLIDILMANAIISKKIPPAILNLKGSVASTAELPLTGNKKGDVWVVTANNSEWVWMSDNASGSLSDYDDFGTVVDLSPYRTASDQDTIDSGKQSKVTASGILKGDGNGGISAAVAGTDYDTASNIVSATAAMTPEQAAQTRQNIGADTPATVTAWLNEHVDPETGYVLDNSLTIQGAAADAKATGDAIDRLTLCDGAKYGHYVQIPEKIRSAVIKTEIETEKSTVRLSVGAGNQLFYPYRDNGVISKNGLTFTVNADKTITVNGLATADTTWSINYDTAPLLDFDVYAYLSGVTGGSANTYGIKNVRSGIVYYEDARIIKNGMEGYTLNLAIFVKSGAQLDHVTFAPMLSRDPGTPFVPPATIYTASVQAADTEHTWDNLNLSGIENAMLIAESGDIVDASYVYERSLNDVVQDISVNQWANKKWVAFGTSITDIGIANSAVDPNGDPSGKYPPYLAKMAGFTPLSPVRTVNKSMSNCMGIAGGRISGQILYYIRYYLHDINSVESKLNNADLVTIEGSVNDFNGNVPLGEVGDTVPYTNGSDQGSVYLPDATSNGSFAGACYCAFKQAIEYAPNATVVFLTETTGKPWRNNVDFSWNHKNGIGLTQYDYIKMAIDVAKYVGIPVIDCGSKSMINAANPQYIVDHIHHTYLGGYQYASTIWQELRQIPNKASALPR